MWGQGIDVTGYIDCPYMVSQYLLFHSTAIKAILREIQDKKPKSVILSPQFDP